MEKFSKAADSWTLELSESLVSMQVQTMTLGIAALAASAIALYLWRTNLSLARRFAALTERYERTESENAVLRRALSAHRDQEGSRISRLEHDLRSPLGVIRGFSTLLKEFVEAHAKDLPGFPVRTVSGIDQATEKMLQIIEASVEANSAPASCEEAVAKEENRCS